MERSVNNQKDFGQLNSPSDDSVFGVLRNGFRNYRSVFDFIPLFSRRSQSGRSSSSEDHHVHSSEQIEMSHLQNGIGSDHDYGTILRAPAKGHDFRAQQLTNPTWCDECGNFIWGVYKQCLKCESKSCLYL